MSLELPARFGKYELVQLIARGGMAEVYRARTMGIGGFEKWVAIKKVLPHLSENKDYMTMLIDEAKISVALNHANIAQVLDLGRINDSYFIAMEYVHGMDLASILKTCAYNNFTIPFEHTIHIAMQVCSGLHHAHSKTDESGTNLGIIHRDVSPHNVLVSYDGEVKVIDFGVAKASVKLTNTMSGIIKGKLLYMAPEQAMAKPLDPRADLFAVGLVLYKMTTGRLPFEGENEFQVYNKLVAGKVMSPRKVNPAIPEGLDRVMVKVLSKKPSGRQSDAMAVRNDLSAVLQGLDPGYTASRLARFMETYFPPPPINTGESEAVAATQGAGQDGSQTQPDTPAPSLSLGARPQPGPPPPPPPSTSLAEAHGSEPDLRPTRPVQGIPDHLASPDPPPAAAPPAEIPTVDIAPEILARAASHLPTQDMHTVAAFVPPMARDRMPRWRIVLGSLLALGVLAGVGFGAQRFLMTTAPHERGGASSPSSVASATPVTPTTDPAPKPADGRAAQPTLQKVVAKPLAPNMIAVRLKSKPSGAKVFQADVLIGKTPTSLVLPRKPGAKRRYVIKRAGYKTVKKWIRMDKDSTVKVRLKKKK